MSWSLSGNHGDAQDPLVTGALLAAGKALYIANAFEAKCRFVLRIANLATYVSAHEDASLADAIASLAKDKLLHPTLERLKAFPVVRPSEALVLDRTRVARNFVAHEGAAFGYVFDADTRSVVSHLGNLRLAVADLAAGDNIVSRWVYEIEQKEAAPTAILSRYPQLVDQWIFGDLDVALPPQRSDSAE